MFVRRGELRRATSDEINFAGAEWRNPAARMKMREVHIVPLSQQAIGILREIEPFTGNGIPVKPDVPRYIFPGGRSRERPMSGGAILAALRRMPLTPLVTKHGDIIFGTCFNLELAETS